MILNCKEQQQQQKTQNKNKQKTPPKQPNKKEQKGVDFLVLEKRGIEKNQRRNYWK